MTSRITSMPPEPAVLPARWGELPRLYEDPDEEDMGESNPHVTNDETLHICIQAHLAKQSRYAVYANMNLYYPGPRHPKTGQLPCVSPDNMVVTPFQPLPEEVTSYTIDKDGPAPVAVAEILSQRSAKQGDLEEKVVLYARLGVAEYILVDPSGKFLPQRLLLKRLQADGTYRNETDPDGGVTSQLGFRLILDADGKLRVLDAASGRPYVRPHEAETEVRQAEQERAREAEARRQAEEQLRSASEEIKALQEEIKRLRTEKAKETDG